MQQLERQRIINHLSRILDSTQELGYATDQMSLSRLNIRVCELELAYDHYIDEDPHASNDDYYFQPMESGHIQEHPLMSSYSPSTEDSTDSSPDSGYGSPGMRSTHAADDTLFNISAPGVTTHRIAWHFDQGLRWFHPYPCNELIRRTLWYNPLTQQQREYVLGNYSRANCDHVFPAQYNTHDRWFIRNAFVASRPYGYPHEIFIVGQDHVSDADDKLMYGEIVTILQAMIARYKLARPEFMRHKVMPIMLISAIHTKARIIQAHYNGSEIVIRVSRLIDPALEEPHNGYELFARYLASEPVGDTTRFPRRTPEPRRYRRVLRANVRSNARTRPRRMADQAEFGLPGPSASKRRRVLD
ncbi:uncharacterized protein BJX67DRAFT_384921 [Aspergillus lucknowensis]|uniref:HNH nuclease domain-containing protein n=1 Tax=Aspergillus lucknowensis TaxID=176173 RepID=A0ABR4LFF3_9EURO